MNRLESIKERLEKGHYIVVHESAYGTPYHDSGPEEDIEYLLQRLERYETACKKIFHNAYLDVKGEDAELMRMMCGNIAEEALKEE